MSKEFEHFLSDRVQPQFRDIVRAFVAQMARVAPEATLRMRGQLPGPTAVGRAIERHGWGAASFIVAGSAVGAVAVMVIFGRQLRG